MWKTINIV